MPTLVHRNVEAARAGTNPTVICRVDPGWIVLGNDQFLRGYSLLLPDPVEADLNALSPDRRRDFLMAMAIVGDALLEVTDAYRINYEILGNQDPALHAHIFPRYLREPHEYRTGPAFSYPKELRRSVPFDLERDRPLMQAIASAVKRRM